jgi:hypothetical protein
LSRSPVIGPMSLSIITLVPQVKQSFNLFFHYVHTGH